LKGIIEIEELRTVTKKDAEGNPVEVVVGRGAEMKILHKETGAVLATNNIPYSSNLYVKNGAKLEKGQLFVNGIHIMH
jgi:DNA-directed RNA polymerase subunit beta'